MTAPYFKPLTIGGKTEHFGHLEPFTFKIDSRLAKKHLRVHVTFSNHCFSKGYDPTSHAAGDPIIDPKSPRPRMFCPIRYRLSLGLPAIISSLNHPKAAVWQTSRERNWSHSITIEDPAGPYHVFFEVRRAGNHQKQWQDLNLVVESAYHETEDPPDLLGSMGFLLLCGKIYLRQPTATKR